MYDKKREINFFRVRLLLTKLNGLFPVTSHTSYVYEGFHIFVKFQKIYQQTYLLVILTRNERKKKSRYLFFELWHGIGGRVSAGHSLMD